MKKIPLVKILVLIHSACPHKIYATHYFSFSTLCDFYLVCNLWLEKFAGWLAIRGGGGEERL